MEAGCSPVSRSQNIIAPLRLEKSVAVLSDVYICYIITYTLQYNIKYYQCPVWYCMYDMGWYNTNHTIQYRMYYNIMFYVQVM